MAHSLKVGQSITMGKNDGRHVTYRVSTDRTVTSLFFSLSLYSVWDHKEDATHTQAESSHLIPPKLGNLSHTHTQECVSQMTPDPVNWATNTNITPSSLQIWDPTPVIFCYRNVTATYGFGADTIRRKK